MLRLSPETRRNHAEDLLPARQPPLDARRRLASGHPGRFAWIARTGGVGTPEPAPDKVTPAATTTCGGVWRQAALEIRECSRAEAGLSVCVPKVWGMTRYVDEDLHGVEFRECDLTGARLIGVVMPDAVIDGLVTNLVVNGVEVTRYVEAELDRRHPVRVLIRSEDPADLREAARQLHAGWAATIERIRRTPGIERRSVNDEWSAVQTLRHLVFVHDSWFRRCCLGSTQLFTPMGIGTSAEPYRGAHGLDLSSDPALDEIVSVREAQAAELEAWLDKVTAARLAARAPVPDDDVWPPYARGRSVLQCLRTVLNETFEHHGFCVRDLDLIRHRTAE